MTQTMLERAEKNALNDWSAERVYRWADGISCAMVADSDHKSLQPFLIVMERSKFEQMMDSETAPKYVHYDHDKKFKFVSSGWRICGLPIRCVPDGDWKKKVINPYPLVMNRLQAQMNFGGEYA